MFLTFDRISNKMLLLRLKEVFKIYKHFHGINFLIWLLARNINKIYNKFKS